MGVIRPKPRRCLTAAAGIFERPWRVCRRVAERALRPCDPPKDPRVRVPHLQGVHRARPTRERLFAPIADSHRPSASISRAGAACDGLAPLLPGVQVVAAQLARKDADVQLRLLASLWS